MIRSSQRNYAAVFAIASILAGRTASADPGLGYADVAYALPYHAAWSSIVENDKRVTESEVGLRSDLGLPAFSGGIGLGYSGLNGQLDFHNALKLTTGALTIGIREKLSLAGSSCGCAPELDRRSLLTRTR